MSSVFSSLSLFVVSNLKAELFENTFSQITKNSLKLMSSNSAHKIAAIIIDNTAEEIRDLAIEIDQRLKNNWVPQEGDEELQEIDALAKEFKEELSFEEG